MEGQRHGTGWSEEEFHGFGSVQKNSHTKKTKKITNIIPTIVVIGSSFKGLSILGSQCRLQFLALVFRPFLRNGSVFSQVHLLFYRAASYRGTV